MSNEEPKITNRGIAIFVGAIIFLLGFVYVTLKLFDDDNTSSSSSGDVKLNEIQRLIDEGELDKALSLVPELKPTSKQHDYLKIIARAQCEVQMDELTDKLEALDPLLFEKDYQKLVFEPELKRKVITMSKNRF